MAIGSCCEEFGLRSGCVLTDDFVIITHHMPLTDTVPAPVRS